MEEAVKSVKQYSVWIALAVLAVLGIWMALDLKKPVREPGENPKVSDLLGMAPADVVQVEITTESNTTVLAKNGPAWSMEKPIRAAADPDQVKQMVDGILDHATDFQLDHPSASELAGYQLDKPAATASLSDKSGKKLTIQFGAKGADKSSVYARDVSIGRVFTVSSSDFDSLKKDASSLRDRTVISAPTDSIEAITIHRASDYVELHKTGSKWQIVKPWSAPADDSAAGMLADALKSVKCERFVPGDPFKYGLDMPGLIVEVKLKDGKTQRLEIGNKVKNEVYATSFPDKGGLLALSESTVKSLDKSVHDLRDRKLVDFEPSDAVHVSVTSPKGSWEAEKKGEDWLFVNPMKGQKADKSKLENLFFDIKTPAARHVEENAKDLAKYGLDKPQLTTYVMLKGGAKKELRLGKKAPKGDYYASGSDAPGAVFEDAGSSFANLNKKAEDVK